MIRKINLIVACGAGNRVIGKDGVMPWHIPIDLKYFKARTTDNVVVMGRNTYESIGKPLPRRANFVVTRKDSHTIKRDFGLFVYNDLMAALESATTFKEKDVFGRSSLTLVKRLTRRWRSLRRMTKVTQQKCKSCKPNCS